MATEILTVDNSSQNSGTQVKVQLISRNTDISLPKDLAPILVPTNFRRYGLSSIVNHLLGTETPTPFDFLASGSFLRTTIDKHLTENGLSSENILVLECVRSVVPPSRVASFEHDDWVSSVDVLSRSSQAGLLEEVRAGHERILSGSYDGILRVWNMSSVTVATSTPPHSRGPSSIKSAKFLSGSKIASSGFDREIQIWDFLEGRDDTALRPVMTLCGHQASVDRLSTVSSRILSSSSDHSVGLWTFDTDEAVPFESLQGTTPESSKRRKVEPSKYGPLSLLRAHTAPVSDSVFSPTDSTVGYSVSWDHTLRTWDLATSVLVDTRTTSHSLLSLAALSSVKLLAAGTSARHVTLIDPRVSASTVSAMTLRGHSGAVVSLSTDPGSEWGIVSGSHDGTCRIWDIRATKAGESGAVGHSTYTINRESTGETKPRVAGDGIKVFGVVWDQSVGIVSGGEDKRVQINS